MIREEWGRIEEEEGLGGKGGMGRVEEGEGLG